MDEQSVPFESLCFFLATGHTFTFRDVRIVRDNETAITIEYIAMSDGRRKQATFFKAHVAGIATNLPTVTA